LLRIPLFSLLSTTPIPPFDADISITDYKIFQIWLTSRFSLLRSIAILKEKAAASRLGDEAGIVNDSPSAFTKPRKAPPAPPSPVRTVVPAILVTPNTPLTPKDNAI
jgi:hypothetical protein